MQAVMTGARLAYVVRPLPGTVKREVCKWNPATKQIDRQLIDKPAGFMVYFPRGHAIRLETREQLKQYNLYADPTIINMDGLHDPKSPAGKLFYAQNDAARRGAMEDMEKQVIALATARSGPNIMPEQNPQLEQDKELPIPSWDKRPDEGETNTSSKRRAA